MTPSDAWATLGIEPTEDERAIRVAYSARLKASDPDSDPQAFVALREARDRALHWARRAARESEPAAELQQDDGTLAQPEVVLEAERHAHDLQAILYAERDPARLHATREERQAILAHWEGIVADPRLQQIGFFSQFEHWAVALITQHLPLSDPLIIPATELFEWTASDDTVAQSREVAVITSRYGWLSYIEEVQDPDHPWHPLWEELSRPGGPGAKRARLGPARVRTLIQAVRAMRPDLMDGFDPARIELWEPQHPDFTPAPPQVIKPRHPALDINPRFIFTGLLLLFLFLLNFVKPPADPPPPRFEPYAQPVAPPEPQQRFLLPDSSQLPPSVRGPANAPHLDEKVIEALRAYEKKPGRLKDGDRFVLGNASE